MDRLGRFQNNQKVFVLDQENQIYFEENDVSELAQAKGANVAGLQIVLKNFNVRLQDIDAFYLAGGFARHLSVDASRRIGLIPNLPDEKIIQVGNASIEGATIALLSRHQRESLEKIVQSIHHVELETDPDFFNYFVDGCQYIMVD